MAINPVLEKRFPSVSYMERAARRRIPRFALEYLTDGLADGVSVSRNRQDIQNVVLMPRYLAEADKPDMVCELFGRQYDVPFGVAPMGASGTIWPRAEFILAQAAVDHNVPYVLSTMANASIEQIGPITGDHGWFQLYTPKPREMLENMLERCKNAGFKTLMVTVDVPIRTRREHLIASGWSIPPRFNLSTLMQIIGKPEWALRMLRSGVPQFINLRPYHDPEGKANTIAAIRQSAYLTRDQIGGHITAERFKLIRDLWKGTLLVKGVLHPDEAKDYLALGADGLIVSNHGGRQLDAAPSAAYALPKIRQAVGPDAVLIADSGVRSGLDVARMIALGANFVLLGRPFLFAVAALDSKGGDHVMNILKAELNQAMAQLGCRTLAELPSTLVSTGS